MGRFYYVGLGVLLGKGKAALLQATTAAAEDLAAKASANAPVDTGTLAASVHVESVVSSGFTVTATVATGGEAEYAGYVEGGTSKMGAQPYMEPALIENAPRYAEEMARAARGQF